MSPLHKTVNTIAALATGLLSTAVMADNTNGYGVGTAARARNAYDAAAFQSAYRMGQDSSTNYTSYGDRPSELYNGGCQADPPYAYCTGGASGTGGTNFNLTASNSSAGRSQGLDGYPISTGTSSASANLATGQLGASAVGDRWTDYRLAPTWNGGQASARMNDTLNFAVTGAGAASVTNIGVSYIVNGSLGISDLRSNGEVRSDLSFGTASASFAARIGSGSAGVTENHRDGGWLSSGWTINPAGSFQFTGVYALTGANSVLSFNQGLFANADGGVSANYGSTSHFLLTLPSNVSYTSASGTFLSATTLPVPEPSTYALMLAGLGALTLVAKARKR